MNTVTINIVFMGHLSSRAAESSYKIQKQLEFLIARHAGFFIIIIFLRFLKATSILLLWS